MSRADVPLCVCVCVCVCLCTRSVVFNSLQHWTITCQAPLSAGFPRQEYWSGLPFPSTGDLPNSGSEPPSPASAGRLLVPPGFFSGIQKTTCIFFPVQTLAREQCLSAQNRGRGSSGYPRPPRWGGGGRGSKSRAGGSLWLAQPTPHPCTQRPRHRAQLCFPSWNPAGPLVSEPCLICAPLSDLPLGGGGRVAVTGPDSGQAKLLCPVSVPRRRSSLRAWVAELPRQHGDRPGGGGTAPLLLR